MLPLPEAVARRWTEAKAAFESSCRSGPGSWGQPDVDAILDEVAGLVRSIGREELEAVRKSAGGTPRPAARIVLPGDDSSGGPGVTTDHATGSSPRTAAPDAAGASDPGFEVKAATPESTLDLTGGYTPAGSAFEPTKTFSPQARGDRVARKTPTVPGYEIVGVLGRGGMGVVYQATQLGLKRTVALKMILAGEHASATHLGRFAAEARAVAHVKHPGIVQIYEIGEHDGLPYFSLEFCPGGSLDKKLNREPQPPRDAAALLEQLARAMAAAHAAGVVHRDLKPANVLLDEHGAPKVTDFGLAREPEEAGQTRTGSVLGTPMYMSPEQAFGRTREVGPASDQYSLGATLYELITGRPPFQGATVMETLDQVRTREPVPPTQLRPGCPRDLETICLKALQKEPGKRYAGCAELADDLRAFLDGRPIAARPVGKVEKVWRWARRNPLGAAVVALLLVLAVGGPVAAWLIDRQRERAVTNERRANEEWERAEAKSREASENWDRAEAKAREANQNLATANTERKTADERYELYRETAIEAMTDIPTALRQAIYATEAQRQALVVLEGMAARQLTLASARGLPDRELFTVNLLAGEITRLMTGRAKDALQHLEAARVIAERLAKTEQRERAVAKGNHALVLQRLGTFYRDATRRGDVGLKYLGAAERLQRGLVANPETGERPDAELKQSLASTLYDIAETYRGASQFKDALPPCQEGLGLWEEVVRLPATRYTLTAPVRLADANLQLGRILTRLGRDAEAEKALTEAVAQHRQILKDHPTNLAYQRTAADAARELGDFLLMRNRLDAATPLHELDVQLTRGLLRTPEILRGQVQLSNAYYRSATLALKKGDRPTADRHYRQCLNLRLDAAEGKMHEPLNMIRVANAQARCGLHAEASELMESLIRMEVATRALLQFAQRQAAGLMDALVVMEVTILRGSTDRAYVRQAATNIALCADAVSRGRPIAELTDAEKALREKYTARSLQLLEHLINKLGYTDVVVLKTDPDLDGIRAEPRFQALVRFLENRPAKP